MYLYKLPVVKIELKTLATTMTGSKRTVDKTCRAELNRRGYEETRIFNVAHLSGWHIILGKPALQDVRATISASTEPVTLQPPAVDRYSLRTWRGNRVTDQKSDLATATNSSHARADEIAVKAAELDNQFNLVAGFAALFRKEMPRELPPLRKINHTMNMIPGSSWIPTYP